MAGNRPLSNRVGKVPDSAHDPAHDPTDGAPVGRRIVLGLLGIGGLGIVFGSKVQNAISNALGPLESRDPTGLLGMFPLGDVFRYYSVTGRCHTATRPTTDSPSRAWSAPEHVLPR